ncbi:MAG: DUF4214 domain-containing protein [Pseudomonadota bacterium]
MEGAFQRITIIGGIGLPDILGGVAGDVLGDTIGDGFGVGGGTGDDDVDGGGGLEDGDGIPDAGDGDVTGGDVVAAPGALPDKVQNPFGRPLEGSTGPFNSPLKVPDNLGVGFGTPIDVSDDPDDFGGFRDPFDAIFDPSIDVSVFFDDLTPFPPTIDVGTTVTGSISATDDVDPFRISLEEGQVVVIDAFNVGEGIDAVDTILAIVDSSGETLAQNDDFDLSFSFDSKLLFQAPSSGTFTIVVGGFGASEGTYGLSVQSVAQALEPSQEIALLYEAAFGRSADLDGLNFWIGENLSGVSQASIADAFIASPEFVDDIGSLDDLSDVDFINEIFGNVLGRPPEAEALEFYLGVLARPEVDEGDVLLDVALSPENVLSSPEVFGLDQDGDGFAGEFDLFFFPDLVDIL